MRERFQLPIPFWRAQYQLMGGHHRVLFLTLLYAVVMVFGGVAFQRLLRNEPLSSVCSMMIYGLLAIQAFLMLIGGSNAVHRAQARDYDTKMLESHRLTPMSNIGVVLGYLIGPNLQVLMLFAITLAIGMGVSGIGGLPLGDWVVGNMLLLVAAVMVWSGVVFSGMRPAKPISPAWVIIGLGALFMPLALFPGSGTFLGIYPVILGIWVALGKVPPTEPALLLVGGVSVVLTAFWLYAAAAKYRRPDLPALNALRGMTLLLLWLFISVGGIVAYVALSKSSFAWMRSEEIIPVQWLSTLILSMVIGAFITIGVSECNIAVRRGRQPRGWGDRASDVTVALIAAIVICGVCASLGQTIWSDFAPRAATQGEASWWALQYWGLTIAAILLALITARGVFRLTALGFSFKAPLVVTWTVLIALWAIPPGIDGIRIQAVANFDDDLVYSVMMTCSPGGLLATVWLDLTAPVLIGLIFQVILAVGVTVLARRSARNKAF